MLWGVNFNGAAGDDWDANPQGGSDTQYMYPTKIYSYNSNYWNIAIGSDGKPSFVSDAEASNGVALRFGGDVASGVAADARYYMDTSGDNSWESGAGAVEDTSEWRKQRVKIDNNTLYRCSIRVRANDDPYDLTQKFDFGFMGYNTTNSEYLNWKWDNNNTTSPSQYT